MTLIDSLISSDTKDKFSVDIKIPGTSFSFPMTIIRGKPGACTLIQAGLHNAEFVGIETALQLIKTLEPSEITGTLLIIPLLNTSGFFNRTMSTVYEDGKNLNRVFPGSTEGSLSERIAHFLTEEIYSHLDYFIDLHSGDCYESLDEFVYSQGKAVEEVVDKSEIMAQAVDVPFIVSSKNDTGGAYNYAAQLGVPAILIERGSGGLWSEEEVRRTSRDVINVLKTIGMIKGRAKIKEKPIYTDVVYESSGEDGFWYPLVKVGNFFKSGTTLGLVKNLSGEILQEVKAHSNGFVLYETVSLNVLKNDPLISYVEV